MTRILGIDLGTNSIGWAITEQEENNYKLIDKGVDIFQEGVAREKNNEKPMVQERTNARALRRHYFRRRLRKIEILKVLIEYRLCPQLTNENLNNWRYKKQYPLDTAFLQWLRTNEEDDRNPYHDRFIALTETLDLQKESDRFTLGRALYHIGQRRGFLNNRKDTSKDEENGKVKSAIKELEKEIADARCKYIGEFYYKLYKDGNNIRNKNMGKGWGYANRNTHYLKEFKAICEKQNLPEDLQNALQRAIFFQRPLKSQKGLVGKCTFEKKKARCPQSHPRFEEFRMLQIINNIKIRTPHDELLRPLTPEERKEVISVFMRKSKPHFDFEDIAKRLISNKKCTYGYYKEDRDKDKDYLFNYKPTTTISGCPTTAALKDIFGDEWLQTICSIYQKAEGKNEEQILNDVWHALISFDDEEKLCEWARNNLQLNDEEAKKFINIKITQGYASLSLNAINKTLPYLRAGYRYDEAVFLGNLRSVVGKDLWNDEDMRGKIIKDICTAIEDYSITKRKETKKEFIAAMLLDNYGIDYTHSDKLYHPSQVEGYKDAEPNENGILQLGSPRTSSVRNPMAMRSLFRLRALINTLLRENKIDKKTRINIEMARELNDANKRAAIKQYQDEQEKKAQRICRRDKKTIQRRNRIGYYTHQ